MSKVGVRARAPARGRTASASTVATRGSAASSRAWLTVRRAAIPLRAVLHWYTGSPASTEASSAVLGGPHPGPVDRGAHRRRRRGRAGVARGRAPSAQRHQVQRVAVGSGRRSGGRGRRQGPGRGQGRRLGGECDARHGSSPFSSGDRGESHHCPSAPGAQSIGSRAGRRSFGPAYGLGVRLGAGPGSPPPGGLPRLAACAGDRVRPRHDPDRHHARLPGDPARARPRAGVDLPVEELAAALGPPLRPPLAPHLPADAIVPGAVDRFRELYVDHAIGRCRCCRVRIEALAAVRRLGGRVACWSPASSRPTPSATWTTSGSTSTSSSARCGERARRQPCAPRASPAYVG